MATGTLDITQGIGELHITHTITQDFPNIKRVILNRPATIVLWDDGTKTIVRCGSKDTYDPEKGLAMAISKRVLGNTSKYLKTFRKYMEPEITKNVAIEIMRDSLSKLCAEQKSCEGCPLRGKHNKTFYGMSPSQIEKAFKLAFKKEGEKE